MVGIVLVSHAGMAEGMLTSASMLYGEYDQVAALALLPDINPDDFQSLLEAKIREVDTGEGVFVLADLMGGTPCNRAMYFAGEKVRLFTGMNLPMLLSVLSHRDEGESFEEMAEEIVSEARVGIVDVNALLNKREADKK